MSLSLILLHLPTSGYTIRKAKPKKSAQGCFSVDSPHSYPHRLTKYLSTTEHEEWQVVDTMHLSTQSFDF